MVGDCVPSGALLLARTQDASATVPLRFRFVMLGQKPGASQMRGASILSQRRRPVTDSEVDKGRDEVRRLLADSLLLDFRRGYRTSLTTARL